jgi:hypothetical protein
MVIEINIPDNMDGYEAYRLCWMLEQGHSLSELMAELRDYQYDDPEDSDRLSAPVTELFDGWEEESGFGGFLWVCPGEYNVSAEGEIFG